MPSGALKMHHWAFLFAPGDCEALRNFAVRRKRIKPQIANQQHAKHLTLGVCLPGGTGTTKPLEGHMADKSTNAERGQKIGTGQRDNTKTETNKSPSLWFGTALMVVKLCLLFGGISLVHQSGIADKLISFGMFATLVYIELEPYFSGHRATRQKVLRPSTLGSTELQYEDSTQLTKR
jgi:hypothetical protein